MTMFVTRTIITFYGEKKDSIYHKIAKNENDTCRATAFMDHILLKLCRKSERTTAYATLSWLTLEKFTFKNPSAVKKFYVCKYFEFDDPSRFSKIVSSKERVHSLVFCGFSYYHKSHLSWKFHFNSSICSGDMMIFCVNINYFHQFLSIFWILLCFLVIKNVMTSLITDDVSIFSLST